MSNIVNSNQRSCSKQNNKISSFYVQTFATSERAVSCWVFFNYTASTKYLILKKSIKNWIYYNFYSLHSLCVSDGCQATVLWLCQITAFMVWETLKSCKHLYVVIDIAGVRFTISSIIRTFGVPEVKTNFARELDAIRESRCCLHLPFTRHIPLFINVYFFNIFALYFCSKA